MRVLIMASGNIQDIPVFVKEQAEAIGRQGIEYDYFIIKGRGLFGYLKNWPRYKQVISEKHYDLVHAHYGFSGMLGILQRKVPVVITYHGSDIHYWRYRQISKLASILARKIILAGPSLAKKMIGQNKSSIIPCGIDLKQFHPMDKLKAREYFNFSRDQKIIVFSSSFDVKEKNYSLAKEALSRIEEHTLIELKGYSRSEVNMILNAADLLLITSKYESGPLIAKEAMACNCPIVSTNVGDVGWVIGETEGCYLTTNHPEDIAEKIKLGISYAKIHIKTNGRERIQKLKVDEDSIAEKIIEVYNSVLN